jgi:hypothetical protein
MRFAKQEKAEAAPTQWRRPSFPPMAVSSGEDEDLLFVEYLRLAFRFGGFLGYSTAAEHPRELTALSEGLNEF